MHHAKILVIMDNSTNNNCEYYNDLDTNFKLAYELCEQEYSHEELLNLLKTGNIPQKQIAALKFDSINDKNDVSALLNNLTGCDGKIREAIALKINSLLTNNEQARKLFSELSSKVFADATIDINANICKLIVNSAALLKDYNDFCTSYTKHIITFTNESLEELDKFIFRDKKYVINKQLFKLYWCLEALSEFWKYTDEQTLKNIVEKCANQSEYTIREKTAQLILKTNKFNNIREKLMNDENYYVREALHHPCFL